MHLVKEETNYQSIHHLPHLPKLMRKKSLLHCSSRTFPCTYKFFFCFVLIPKYVEHSLSFNGNVIWERWKFPSWKCIKRPQLLFFRAAKAEIECGEAGDLGCAPTTPHLDTGRVKPPASSARHGPAPPPAGNGGSAPIMLPALGWDGTEIKVTPEPEPHTLRKWLSGKGEESGCAVRPVWVRQGRRAVGTNESGC